MCVCCIILLFLFLQGCSQALESFFQDNLAVVAGIAITFGLLQASSSSLLYLSLNFSITTDHRCLHVLFRSCGGSSRDREVRSGLK